QIRRDAMRFERVGRAGDERWEIEKSLHELRLFRQVEHRKVPLLAGGRRLIDLADAEDPGHARVRHLDVVDRILIRLRARDVDVEHELRVPLAQWEDKSN